MEQEKEYLERIVKVLIYIEEHIYDELSLEKLAKIAYYSPFHFHRIFHAIVGETIHSYVKRVRMERAMGLLRYTNSPITEIGFDAGFETTSAFTKAFNQFTGVSPSKYRRLYDVFVAMEKKIKDLAMIQPTSIVNQPALDLLFVRRYGSWDTSPKEAWSAMYKYIQENALPLSETRYFGISYDDPDVVSEENRRYDAAILARGDAKAEGEVGILHLSQGRYALFTHKGPYENLGETYNQIFLKWFPSVSEKESFDEKRRCFCEYMNMGHKDSEELLTTIYIPLVSS